MVAFNSGYVVLNADARASKPRVFCVLGMPRGGTTMTARLLSASGVFMGENLPVTHEDPEFAELLKVPSPDRSRFLELVKGRSLIHRNWGFKAPYRFHPRLLEMIPDVGFVVVIRDVVAIGVRNSISTSVDALDSIVANMNLQRELLGFAQFTKAPVFLFSYEKAVVSPEIIARGLIDFIGAEPSDKVRRKLTSVIQPNEIAYAAAMTPAEVPSKGNIDVFTNDRIDGWVAVEGQPRTEVQVLIDGVDFGSAIANQHRPDVGKHLEDHGLHGFSIKLTKPLPKGRPLLQVCDASTGATLLTKRFGG